MAFTSSPREVSPAYRPLWWRETRTTTAAVEQMKVELYVYGSLYRTYNKAWYSSAGGTYSFDYDVQRALQDYLQPDPDSLSSVFGDLATWQIAFNTDCFAPFYVHTTELQRNASNFLEEVGATSAASSTAYAFNATTQNTEDYTLDPYWYGASSAAGIKFLTHAPTAQEISLTEGAFISLISEGMDAMEFNFYTSVGALLSTVTTRITSSADLGTVQMVSLGIGPAQITNGAGATILAGGSLPTNMSNVGYYTIQAGRWHASSGFLDRSELRQYNVVDRCADQERFHFLNRVGGVDSYTFFGNIRQRQRTESDEYERGLNWSITGSLRHRPYFRGPFKGNIEAGIEMDVTTSQTAAEATWLREMLSSPEVYREVDGTYENVLIRDTTQEFDNNQAFAQEFSFRAKLNGEFTQRN